VDEPPHLSGVDEPGVDFTNACSRDHLTRVVLPNSPTRDNRDPLACLIHQRRNDIGAFKSSIGAA
jgi:hypothetical protein